MKNLQASQSKNEPDDYLLFDCSTKSSKERYWLIVSLSSPKLVQYLRKSVSYEYEK